MGVNNTKSPRLHKHPNYAVHTHNFFYKGIHMYLVFQEDPLHSIRVGLLLPPLPNFTLILFLLLGRSGWLKSIYVYESKKHANKLEGKRIKYLQNE